MFSFALLEHGIRDLRDYLQHALLIRQARQKFITRDSIVFRVHTEFYSTHTVLAVLSTPRVPALFTTTAIFNMLCMPPELQFKSPSYLGSSKD